MFDLSAFSFETIKLSLAQKVLTVSLNRSKFENRVNLAMARELHQLASSLRFEEQAVRVVIIKAEQIFSAGFDDIDWDDTAAKSLSTGANQNQDLVNELFAKSFQQLPQPVLAMVQGDCLGEAVALLTACDIVFASNDALFGFEAINAAQASERGWVTLAFASEALEKETYGLATELTKKDASALRLAKESLQHIGDMSWGAVQSYTTGKQAELKALQAASAQSPTQTVSRFLSGKSKPGLGA